MPGWVFGSIFERALDFLFPRYCYLCGKPLQREEVLFCLPCQEGLPRLGRACLVCAKPLNQEEELCRDCQKGRPFSRVLVPFLYEDPLAQAIKELKYQGSLWLAKELARLWRQEIPSETFDLVLPVPLHPKRLRERGFNQSLLLARFFDKGPLSTTALIRKRYTKPQVELNPRERQKNVKGAFKIRDQKALLGRKVLLVDDVMTTGATIEECALELKKAGANEIVVAVVARAG